MTTILYWLIAIAVVIIRPPSIMMLWIPLAAASTWIVFYQSAEISFEQDSVTFRYRFGTYQMKRQDIQSIVSAWGNLYFEGNGKKLTIPGWNQWEGFTPTEAKTLLKQFAHEEEIITSYRLNYFLPSWQEVKS